MSEPTTHDVQMLRYSEEWQPSGPPPVQPLADLQAALTVADPSPGPVPPAPTSEQAAPVTLADALKRLADAREQIAIAERDFAAIAAHLSGHN